MYNGGKNRVGPNTWAEVVPSLLSVVPKEVDKADILHNFILTSFRLRASDGLSST